MAAVHQDLLNMVKLFRKHWSTLPGCERTTLCGADCMLRILQLSMAEANKQSCGEFAVPLSDLLATWKYFLHDKLGLQDDLEEPEGYVPVRAAYDVFLKRSNVLDLIDVYLKCAKLESTIRLLSPIQILEFISAGPPNSEERDQILSTISTPSSRPSQDSTKLQLAMKRIICAYLSLLVNSKNDLAMAYTLNVPDRGLGRAAFTDLKHASQDKRMSLFLVATSFIRTLELGGKGYAPSQSDPLRTHLKGLSGFVGFIDKLDEMLGEISDPSIAVGRILSAIKMNLIRGWSSGDRYYGAAVDVIQDLELRIQNIIDGQCGAVHDITGISPARPKMHAINHGTASSGRDTVKALLALLDEEAANPPIPNKADILCADEESCVFGAGSVLTLFRSPEQANESSPKSLRHRVQKSMDEKKKMKQTLIRSQFACTYKDDHMMAPKPLDFLSTSQVPTCVHPAPKLLSVLCFDEELLPAKRPPGPGPALAPMSANVHVKSSVSRKGTSDAASGQKGAKRKQVDLNSDGETHPPPKKAAGPKKKPQNRLDTGSKAAAKNPLIAGQGKLTSFFRL